MRSLNKDVSLCVNCVEFGRASGRLYCSCEWVFHPSSPQTVAKLLLCLLNRCHCGQSQSAVPGDAIQQRATREQWSTCFDQGLFFLNYPSSHLPAVLRIHQRIHTALLGQVKDYNDFKPCFHT